LTNNKENVLKKTMRSWSLKIPVVALLLMTVDRSDLRHIMTQAPLAEASLDATASKEDGEQPAPAQPGPHIAEKRLLRSTALAPVLQELGLPGPESAQIQRRWSQWSKRAQLRKDDAVLAEKSEINAPIRRFLIIQNGKLTALIDRKSTSGWQVTAPAESEIEHAVVHVNGKIVKTLWHSMRLAHEHPEIAMRIMDIFSGVIDFSSETRDGNYFDLLVEKEFYQGHFVRYGRIRAAKLKIGQKSYQGFYFEDSKERFSGYYDERGHALKTALLRTPLPFGVITSGFGLRRHPILKRLRPHNGVDFAVPSGTPVWAAGHGKVIRAGYVSGFGNLVEIQHPLGWVSQYAHLSQINVRVGQMVRQKHRIGSVGKSGLATGPHLHYGLKRYGRYVNVMAQKNLNIGQRLLREHMVEFLALKLQINKNMRQFDEIEIEVGKLATARSPKKT
jgi:murein DD-endopeptidase MepM/ murein hydrolase activator NlpD